MANGNTAPCRVSADLRRYERTQEDSAAYFKRVKDIADALAHELIGDGKRLKDLVLDNEVELFDELARAMRSLNGACHQNAIDVETCLNALSQIERMLLHRALDDVCELAERRAQEPYVNED